MTATQGLTTTNAANVQRSDNRLDTLRDVADRVVGSVFYNTLLQQMRSSTLKGEYGHGGRGEEIFQAQLDQVLAERSGQASGSGLSDAIVRRFTHQYNIINNQPDRKGSDL